MKAIPGAVLLWGVMGAAMATLWDGAALAGQNATSKYLLGKPASVMDMGVYRADIKLKRVLEREHAAVLSKVRYDEKRDRVVAQIIDMRNVVKLKGVDKAKARCEKYLGFTRVTFGVDPETGQPARGKASYMGDFFRHAGLDPKIGRDGLHQGVDGISDVFAVVGYTEMGGDMARITCRGPLVGKEVAFE